MMEDLKLAWITGSSMGLSLGLNGRNSCTSVLPELMGYLSMRVNRVVIHGPKHNSAEDIYAPFLESLKKRERNRTK